MKKKDILSRISETMIPFLKEQGYHIPMKEKNGIRLGKPLDRGIACITTGCDYTFMTWRLTYGAHIEFPDLNGVVADFEEYCYGRRNFFPEKTISSFFTRSYLCGGAEAEFPLFEPEDPEAGLHKLMLLMQTDIIPALERAGDIRLWKEDIARHPFQLQHGSFHSDMIAYLYNSFIMVPAIYYFSGSKEYRDVFQLFFQSVKAQVDEGSLSPEDYEAWTDKLNRFIELMENKYLPWYN